VTVAKDISYGSGNKKLDVYYDPARSNQPVVFLCHVRDLNKNDMVRKATWFTDMGYIAVVMNYATVSDIHTSITWFHGQANKYGGDVNRFAIYGYSWGGGNACSAALSGKDKTKMRAQIIVAGASKGHVNMVGGSSPSTLLVHSRDDKTVPFVGSTALEAALKKQGISVDTLYYSKGGHSPQNVNPTEFVNKMKNFLGARFGKLALSETAADGNQTASLLAAAENPESEDAVADEDGAEDAETASAEGVAEEAEPGSDDEPLDEEAALLAQRTSAVTVAKDISYGSGNKKLDVYYDPARSNQPVVFLCHVRDLNKNDMVRKATWFTDMGYIAVVMNYATVSDIHTSITWFHGQANKYGGDVNRFAIYGYSWGGGNACSAALSGKDKTKMRAQIIVAGASKGHVNMVGGSSPSTLLVHSRDDKTVPFVGSTALEAALKKQGISVDTLYYSKGGHSPQNVNPTEFVNKMKNFLGARFGKLALSETAADGNQTASLLAVAEDPESEDATDSDEDAAAAEEEEETSEEDEETIPAEEEDEESESDAAVDDEEETLEEFEEIPAEEEDDKESEADVADVEEEEEEASEEVEPGSDDEPWDEEAALLAERTHTVTVDSDQP